MRRPREYLGRHRVGAIGLMLAVMLVATTVPAWADKPTYESHLENLGFSTLGAPATGVNSDITVNPATGFAYVGAIDEFTVKAVNVSDPTNPTLTAEVAVLGGLAGPFDVKVLGDILAASTQGPPETGPLPELAGVTLFDVSDPANPVAVSHLSGSDFLDLPPLGSGGPFGSHNSALWSDGDRTWLFVAGLDFVSMVIFDVTNPASPERVAYYDNGYEDSIGAFPYIHDLFVQENDDRVLVYHAGIKGVEILDVTGVIDGTCAPECELTFANSVVAYNHYTGLLFGDFNALPSPDVTRPGFSHYIEPNASGDVTWAGDEEACGPPGIARAFDTAELPEPGNAVALEEIGTIIENPDAATCNNVRNVPEARAENARSFGNFHAFENTGHNFDIWGDDLLVRADYSRGVSVYDISDPSAVDRLAQARGLNTGVGAFKSAGGGGGFSFPLIWGVYYDGDLIYASDIAQGMFILDLVEK